MTHAKQKQTGGLWNLYEIVGNKERTVSFSKAELIRFLYLMHGIYPRTTRHPECQFTIRQHNQA